MSTFRYEALEAGGRTVTGLLEASDEREAATLLRGRSLFVLGLEARAGEADPARAAAAGGHGSLRASALVSFFRQVALMVRSGVSLLDALEVVAGASERPAGAGLARRLAEAIRSGASLSQAMAREERVFSELHVRLVESAEVSGELDVVLERIADLVERRAALQRTLLTSLAYPSLVLTVAIGVAVLLVVGVVPRFAKFFAHREIALPWSTQALLDVAAWIHVWGVWVVLALALLLAGLLVARTTGAGRLRIDRSLLRLPVLGGLLRTAAFAQATWTLGTLLRSGVGLLESLRVTAGVLRNRALSAHLRTAAERVLAGSSLARSLQDPLVPTLVWSLVAAGERSGATAEVMHGLAAWHHRDLEHRIRRMSGLIEPVLILAVGGMVGFVYLAFFQALVRLSGR